MTLAAAPLGILGCAESAIASAPPLPAFGSNSTWLNSPPLTPAGLRGRIVLVDFCTYTCINWLRTLPYLRAWNDKYKERGLVLIGVHTPEFEFEHDVDNVRRSLKEMNVDYPVVIDNDYAIWRAFDNQYWPALYFVDAPGRIRDHQFGEGAYDRCERVIQQLLGEAPAGGSASGLVSVQGRGIEADADWSSLKSPETYAGYERGQNFASDGVLFDKPRSYSLPSPLPLNHWALSGNWTIGAYAAVLNGANGSVAFRFHARDLHLVIAPARSPVRMRVRLDGRAPGAAHGIDVDEEGNGTVTEPRLYQLIRQPQRITARTCEIEFLDPGAGVFVFTFG